MADALATHGAKHQNPEWNLTALCSVFSKQGAHAAHMMASAHPDYSQATTQDLFERKQREVEGGLGWPSCAAISNAGSTFCGTCPNRAKGKSPLNFEQRPAPAPTSAIAQLVAQAPSIAPNALAGTPVSVSDLPPGYSRNADGIVSVVMVDEDGNQSFKPVSRYPMVNGMLRGSDPKALFFDTAVEQHGTQRIMLELDVINGMQMRSRLQEQGFMMHPGVDKLLGEFFVTWVAHLQRSQAAVKNVAFGWEYSKAKGEPEGFAYNNKLWSPNGAMVVAPPPGVTMGHYTPCGNIDAWKDAASLVVGCGRPDLEIIVAAAFAAPLIQFTGHEGALLSAFSTESGIGKTTAANLAQAVWGHPKHKMGLTDTPKSAMNKMGELRSLPLFWDELKTKSDTENFVKMTFQITQGRENSRLTSRIEQREPGHWQTLVVSTSNESLLEFVTAGTKTTAAGLMRILEYRVQPSANGAVNSATAQARLARLNYNFGNVGLDYAQWLGANWPTIKLEVERTGEILTDKLKSPRDERFWIGCITSVLLGAKFANERGYTNFDLVAVRDRLFKILEDMREVQNSQPVDLNQSVNVSSIMSDFLTSHHDQMLYTDRMHVGRGRPPGGAVKVIRPPNNNKGVAIHVGQDKTLRISQNVFNEYLRKRSFNTMAVWDALQKRFGAIRTTGFIGAGTLHATMQQHTIHIDMAGHPELDFVDQM